MQKAAKEGKKIVAVPVPRVGIPLHVKVEKTPDSLPSVQARIVLGRELWLHEIKHILTGVVSVLKEHTWVVMNAHPSLTWITSDHPTMRLAFTSPNKYDFGGGWGRKGCEIILPLSPTKLLYTQIGHRPPKSDTFDLGQTTLMLKLLAERAHRWHFSAHMGHRGTFTRDRVVDVLAFQADEERRKRWHDEQANAEREASGGSSPPIAT